MKKPDLEFPHNSAGEYDGLGDAGIETFRDASYASCAREAGQNSRDAELGNGEPVRMTFNVLHLPRDQFPAVDRLAEALDSCLQQAKGGKEKDFFQNALAVISRPKIPVLHIADYNTTGLVGPPNEHGTPFHSLLKSRGVSRKESDTSGGSFGIGKNASVAVSDLQTVFYSTLYKTAQGQEEFAAQGKVILVSHPGPDSLARRATGYWGWPADFSAVTNTNDAPEWMKRTEVGTSIFCMGFREGDGNWEDLMMCSLISNFFGAIREGEMEFEVGSRKINRNTLEVLLASDDLLAAANGTALQDELLFARHLDRCLASGNTITEEISITGLGKMTVRILTDKGMPRRVGFIRNGMLITDNLSYFGHKFQRFPGAKDFICLVEPADAEAGKLLKSLENPQHKDFSADRIADPDKRASAFKAMRALGVRLREMISSNAGVQLESSVVIDELAKLFGEGKNFKSGESSNDKDPEKYLYKVVRQEPKRAAPAATSSGTGGGQAGGHRPGKTNTTDGPNLSNRNGGKGQGESGSVDRRKPIQLTNIRNRIVSSAGAKTNSRVIFFNSEASGRIELSIQALGINAPEQLKTVESNRGTVEKGKIILDLDSQERHSLTVSFDEPYNGPIEIIAVKIGEPEMPL